MHAHDRQYWWGLLELSHLSHSYTYGTGHSAVVKVTPFFAPELGSFYAVVFVNPHLPWDCHLCRHIQSPGIVRAVTFVTHCYIRTLIIRAVTLVTNYYIRTLIIRVVTWLPITTSRHWSVMLSLLSPITTSGHWSFVLSLRASSGKRFGRWYYISCSFMLCEVQFSGVRGF